MRNIFKTSIILCLILLTGGCSKQYLDPVPKTSLSDLSVFDSKDRVVAQVNGMYAQMKNGNFLGGRYFVYNDIRADNFIPKSSNAVTGYSTWTHTENGSSQEVEFLWQYAYLAINSINIFLENLESNWSSGKLNGIITETEKGQYRAEALTLRALAYFDLVQMFAKPYSMNAGENPGLPLRITANKSAADNNMARSTVAQVYAQILSDLNEAESLAITDYGDDLLDVTRVHRNTIIALKTRVYLHMQDWAKVVTEAMKIVSATAPYSASTGVANSLDATYASIFADPFKTKESIFSMPFSTTDQPGSQNGIAWYYAPLSSESYYLSTKTGSLYNQMDNNDARKQMMLQSADGKVFIGKFLDITNNSNYAPVIRYAEVLLNYSEAIVRQGGVVTQTAVDLLNAVRTRSLPTGAHAVADFATVQAFYDAVLNERNIEFLGEGMRNLDLMRLGLPIPEKDGGPYAATIPGVSTTKQSYIWPIPTSELSTNKDMVPNN